MKTIKTALGCLGAILYDLTITPWIWVALVFEGRPVTPLRFERWVRDREKS